MKQVFEEIKIKTEGQGFYNFTESTLDWIEKQKIQNGILNINILHTSASLVVQENADPDVLYDLKNFFHKLVPMDTKLYKHTTEGKDDMPAHIKSALTNNHLPMHHRLEYPHNLNMKNYLHHIHHTHHGS